MSPATSEHPPPAEAGARKADVASGPSRDFSVAKDKDQEGLLTPDHLKFLAVAAGALAFSAVVMLFVYLGSPGGEQEVEQPEQQEL